MLHAIYDDESAVRDLTREHIAAGRTVLQMFQLADTERNHSIRVLELLGTAVGEGSRILSLGCGVGGMERHWHWWVDAPMHFELVNLSQAQLDLCVCPGRKVHADAQHYHSKNGPFDVTVVAYVLGHCDAELVLDCARANTRKGGTVLVLDVFDGSPQFDAFFSYATCSSEEMKAHGFVEQPAPYPWRLMPLIHADSPWVARHATPMIWTRLV